jgi:hypothetical protein
LVKIASEIKELGATHSRGGDGNLVEQELPPQIIWPQAVTKSRLLAEKAHTSRLENYRFLTQMIVAKNCWFFWDFARHKGQAF